MSELTDRLEAAAEEQFTVRWAANARDLLREASSALTDAERREGELREAVTNYLTSGRDKRFEERLRAALDTAKGEG